MHLYTRVCIPQAKERIYNIYYADTVYHTVKQKKIKTKKQKTKIIMESRSIQRLSMARACYRYIRRRRPVYIPQKDYMYPHYNRFVSMIFFFFLLPYLYTHYTTACCRLVLYITYRTLRTNWPLLFWSDWTSLNAATAAAVAVIAGNHIYVRLFCSGVIKTRIHRRRRVLARRAPAYAHCNTYYLLDCYSVHTHKHINILYTNAPER